MRGDTQVKVINVVGARPNLMKIAPIMEAFKTRPHIQTRLVHTGQHYDAAMSDLFFRDLGLPQPDINLGVGSGSHAAQTANIMLAFEPVLLKEKPDLVVVVGDVNSTIACGLVAVKLGIKLAHVEAGLRSFDRTMPEEINRILTDAISDALFCTEKSGVDNLLREGIPPGRIHFVGNVMIDTLLRHRQRAALSPILQRFHLAPRAYAALTLHRPANVDDPRTFSELLGVLETISRDMPIVFPVHPRTRNAFELHGLHQRVSSAKNLLLTEPLGYLDFLHLMDNARVVLTDSGGIQEECTILKVPCVTLRDNTERPVTVECGANIVAGRQPERILAAYREALAICPDSIRTPPYWDGRAAHRIVETLDRLFTPRSPSA